MAKYRNKLPQLDGGLFVTDGGLETTLIYEKGVDLPSFASFQLLRTTEGRQLLEEYLRSYAAIGRDFSTGIILDSATWRASADWGRKLGVTPSQLAEANRAAVELIAGLRAEFETADSPLVIGACIGPRGDGYQPDLSLTVEEAAAYHAGQIQTFADSPADFITAMTLNEVEEAIGIVHASKQADMPVVISFTVETDGRLPTGQSIGDAIQQVDDATGHYAAYFMINCAHPTHLASVAMGGEDWLKRIRGFRANASRLSHADFGKVHQP